MNKYQGRKKRKVLESRTNKKFTHSQAPPLWPSVSHKPPPLYLTCDWLHGASHLVGTFLVELCARPYRPPSPDPQQLARPCHSGILLSPPPPSCQAVPATPYWHWVPTLSPSLRCLSSFLQHFYPPSASSSSILFSSPPLLFLQLSVWLLLYCATFISFAVRRPLTPRPPIPFAASDLSARARLTL